MPQKTVMSIPLPHKNAQVYEGIEAGLSRFGTSGSNSP
jgi:hypothetical protein